MINTINNNNNNNNNTKINKDQEINQVLIIYQNKVILLLYKMMIY